MVHVTITLTITSAICERSFSTMKIINTYLTSNMIQDRFSNLTNVKIEIDINSDNILKIFEKNERKIEI